MTEAIVDSLARTLLYEGYLLYPYRRTSTKNRQRWPFGTLYPPAFCGSAGAGDRWWSQTECLVEGPGQAEVTVEVRFLQLLAPGGEGDSEAIERRAPLGRFPVAAAVGEARVAEVHFSPEAALAGRDRPLALRAELRAVACGGGLFRLAVRVENHTADGSPVREEALLASFASLHLVLRVRGGRFVSLVDPPAALGEAAQRCANEGLWPVLVGAAGARDAMLASPIVLYDHPAIAGESPGDLFDATEIDEILSLRILTLTDAEKAQVRAGEPRGRHLLERTEALGGEALRALHGAIRERPPEGEGGLRPGAPVRLRPRGHADAFDTVLAGRTAVIAAVEQDLEGRYHYAVLIDDDPGQDLGAAGFPGHRFFFRGEELEPL